jgi:hypothetical protein
MRDMSLNRSAQFSAPITCPNDTRLQSSAEYVHPVGQGIFCPYFCEAACGKFRALAR